MSLHSAAKTGDLPAAKRALSADGQGTINNPNGDGRVPLHYAAQHGYEGILDLLISKGANVNIQTTRHRYTALILAADFSHQAVVRKLVRNRADVNLAGDGRNNTALHKAVVAKDPKILQYLLEHGADPNPIDAEGRTPLGRAASKKDYPRAILLMGFGGRLAEGEAQELPAKLSKGLDLEDLSIRILWAIETSRNPTPIVRNLLATNPKLITSTNARGWRLLHQASRIGDQDLVKLLLNADPKSLNCLTRSGWTPLLLAAEKGHNHVLQLLTKRGADMKVVPSGKNKGRNAVWFAQEAPKCTPLTIEMLKKLALSQGDENQLSDQDTEDEGFSLDSGSGSASGSEVGSFDGKLYSTAKATSASSGYDFFDKLEKTWQNHFQFQQRDKIVKVAVLDTGINLAHPDFQEPRATRFEDGMPKRAKGEEPQIKRISEKGRKNFALAKLDENNVDDLDGHGTKVAGLILRLAPRAELYIARVCDGKDSSKGSEKKGHEKNPRAKTVAAAIGWAIDQEVDIINMSFGFDGAERSSLVPALRRAAEHSVLVFSAMSNGGPTRAAWPARNQHLAIGIHSYSVERNAHSSFTADDVHSNKNFMVPGEGVMTHTLQDPEFEVAEGTSFATPIATAIAALILAYTNQKMCRKQREDAQRWVDVGDLSRISEMTKLLGSLYQTRNGSRYTLIPATLFWDNSIKKGSDEDDKLIAWNKIKRELMH